MTVAHARATDPETSHNAAASIENVTDRQRAVHEALSEYGPITHEELVAKYVETRAVHVWPEQTPSSIRSRCAELVKLDLVRHDGYGRTVNGGKSRTWRALPAGDPPLF